MKLERRLGTVALTSLIIFLSACAHQEEKNANNQSIGWPILATDDHLATSFPRIPPPAPVEGAPPVEKSNPEIAINPNLEQTSVMPPVSPVAEALTAASIDGAQLKKEKQLITADMKPSNIVIPDAKNGDAALDAPLIFDIPVAYNSRVKYWIEFYQTSGKNWYQKWLERSSRYLPILQKTLKRNGLPQDLAYIAMIESGFSSQASSAAKAVGPWQFIRETAKRYGLKVSWWLDERKDFQKSTDAAAKYLKRMYSMFHNWYLVAAGYNTGEYRIKRVIEKHGTKNFWKISQNRDLEEETKDYVPKLIAALLIAKAPQLYGFKHINYSQPLAFELFRVPGGTRLDALADAIGVTPRYLQDLNPELVRGYVPNNVEGHMIKIPKGSSRLVSHYVRSQFVSER